MHMYLPFQSIDLHMIYLPVEMRKLISFYSILILHVALHLAMVHAQDDQSGFISIDCGIPEGSKYTDKRTGLNYVSDTGFIEGGVNGVILPTYNFETLDVELTTLRSFPQNPRSCYTLRPKQGKNNTYLIRVRYLHGNYDSKGQIPHYYNLYLGADLWFQGYITDLSEAYYNEIIHLATSDFINICLVNTSQGISFVSAIELRLLDITMYEPQSTSLDTHLRYSFGSNERVRYEDDKYDRIWYPFTWQGYSVIESSNTISSGTLKVPSKVMNTALTPTISTNSIFFTWVADAITNKFSMYLHFAEVETLTINQTRQFNIYINGDYWYGPFSPSTEITTLETTAPLTGFSNYTLEINRTLNSTLPPIINAIEVYELKQFQQHHTEDQDAAAIWSIKSTYGLKENWQGDPCVPQEYVWDGLNCSYIDLEHVRIISLNLSSSRLSGDIAAALANLTMLESLDLSYNNLTGNVPGFLGKLDNLRILNLMGNNFTRPLPAELLAKLKKGTLTLSIEASSDEDKNSCLEGSCGNKKSKKTIIVVIATVTPIVILLTAFAIVWMIRRRKRKDLTVKDELFPPKNQQLTFQEVQSVTNNFKTVIGRGGFGTVYLGNIGDNQVAVKMLSSSSAQGYKEFQVEVKLLLDVRHKNITSLVGYCDDSNNKGIIYELMANGNLEKHIFDGSPSVLSWERRLQIGCDAAEGLVYMHHGCRPPIVHRDVKPSNILLNKNFQAKLADFGLSRTFTEDATYVSTVVAGTRGYLDPEYYLTNRLTEKSDVYSFGVVLLELITSRRALSEDINIIEWVKSMVAEGRVEKVIDPRLEGKFSINTAWKVVELAIGCVSYTSIKRPSMNDVAIELNNCLQAERTHHVLPYNQRVHVLYNIENASGPNPR